jgi:hypothetical protein
LPDASLRAIARTDPPGEIVDRAMRWHAVLVHAGGPMQTDSERTAGRERRDYRITVRGDASQVFVDALECVVVESTGDESTLYCEAVDQAKLQAVLGWLYSRRVEILRVVPAYDGVASGNERLSKGQHDG